MVWILAIVIFGMDPIALLTSYPAANPPGFTSFGESGTGWAPGKQHAFRGGWREVNQGHNR